MRLRSFLLILIALCCGSASARREIAPPSDWLLTWSDEFSAPDGSAPDPKKWIADIGGQGWGNGELESYTARPQNVRVDRGNLVIEARQENFRGSDGIRRDYTSARLKTQSLFAQRYGLFEARIQIPAGQGLWPAFWLLGDNFSTTGWPACGEIDIMENAGAHEPSTIHGSLHGPGYSDANALTASYTLPHGRFSDDFHLFAIYWSPDRVQFFVDGHLYRTRSPSDLPKGRPWVFDRPFFILLNLAVGGRMPGGPERSTVFPERMLVDYVRVYSHR
jgi:beta-glucanase (GH16 family)